MSNLPKLVDVSVFPTECGLEYGLLLKYDGFDAKYVLKVPKLADDINNVCIDGFVFNRDIFENFKIESDETGIKSIKWSNGFALTANELRENSSIFYNPREFDEVKFEDNKRKVTKVLEWDGRLYEDMDDEDCITVSFPRRYDGNDRYYLTILDKNYRRLTNVDFEDIGELISGRRLVHVYNRGYGYLDEKGKFVIPPIYDRATEFRAGYANVQIDENDPTTEMLIDKFGNKVSFDCKFDPTELKFYMEHEGLIRFSPINYAVKLGQYGFELEYKAGINGYLDTQGNVVVEPQYIYADDFYNGMAVVCKGTCVEENGMLVCKEYGKWGIIDKKGNEILSFDYDYLDIFRDAENWEVVLPNYFFAIKNGRTGIINRNGDWLTEDGLVFSGYHEMYRARYLDCSYEGHDEEGIYDLLSQRFIVEPKYTYAYLEDDFFFCEKENSGKIAYYDFNGNDVTERRLLEKKNKAALEKFSVSGRKGKQGLKDNTGKLVIPEKYDEVRLPDEYGFVDVIIGSSRVVNAFNCGFLTTSNKVVFDPEEYYMILHGSNNRLIAHRKKENITEIHVVEMKNEHI